MRQHVKKSLVSAALAGVLLFSTAQGAAQYQPVDPANPYLPPVSGIFHGQEIHEENGTYSV